MHPITKRVLSVLLAALLAAMMQMSVLPAPSFAEGDDGGTVCFVQTYRLEDGREYLFVDAGGVGQTANAIAVNGSGSAIVTEHVRFSESTIDGSLFVSDAKASAVWTAEETDSGWRFGNDGRYLNPSTGAVGLTDASGTRRWDASKTQEQFFLRYRDGGKWYYLHYLNNNNYDIWKLDPDSTYSYNVYFLEKHLLKFGGFVWGGGDTDGCTAKAVYSCVSENHDGCSLAEIMLDAAVSSELETPAACTTPGKMVYTAAVSAADSYDGTAHTEKKTVTIPAAGHREEPDAAVEATCTESGLTEGTHCSVCGEVIVAQETVAALGHDWGEWVQTTAPTCTGEGAEERVCSRCGDRETGSVAAAGHKPVPDAAVEATCTATGLTEGAHCSVCQAVLAAQEVIPATGHTPVTDEAVEATCTETGLTEGTHCSVCQAVLAAQEVIPATGHTPVTDEAVEATCTETGLTEGTHCSVCGEVIVAQETVAVLGHDWGGWVQIKAPTCTEEGAVTRTCGRCRKAETETVEALGHRIVTEAGSPATCTEDGLTEETHCAVCGAVLEAHTRIPATGHTPVTDEAVEATCTESGLTKGTHCSVCGDVLVKQEEIPALGHRYIRYVSNGDATCTENGTETAVCDRCGATDTRTEENSAVGHRADEPVEENRVEPTCTMPGKVDRVIRCAVCGQEFSRTEEVIPACGHVMTHHDAVPATCTEDGTIAYDSCSRCGKNFRDESGGEELTDIIDPKTGHLWDGGRVTRPATADAPGERVCTCERCGAVRTEEIPKLTPGKIGDVNADGLVDATDRMILARYLAGWEGYADRILSMDAADIDGSGAVEAADRVILARYLAGWKGYESYFE